MMTENQKKIDDAIGETSVHVSLTIREWREVVGCLTCSETPVEKEIGLRLGSYIGQNIIGGSSVLGEFVQPRRIE